MYFIRFVLFIVDAVSDFLTKNGPYLAAAISFYTLFSLFPLVLGLMSIAGFLVSDEVRLGLIDQISEVIPVPTGFITDTVEGIVRARTITGIAGGIGMLWAATAAFGAIRKGINATWGIRRARPFLRERLMDFTLVLGAGLVLVILMISAPIFVFLSQITEYVAPQLEIVRSFWNLTSQLTSSILTFLTFVLLYKFMPYTRVKLSDVWFGALLAAVAFEGAKWGFVWYVKTVPVYNVVPSAVGAIMALLMWVYVSAIILLVGALMTSRYAAFAAASRKEDRGVKLLWTGISRVRLRVVAAAEAG